MGFTKFNSESKTCDLEKMSLDELKKLRDEKKAMNAKLQSEIDSIQGTLEEFAREQERKEEFMMNSYTSQIIELREQNEELQKKIQIEELDIVANLYERYKKVLKEKENLQDLLQKEENDVIEKLLFDINSLKTIEIKLETELSHAGKENKPIETNLVDEELEKLYEQSEKTKNDYNRELRNLIFEVEKCKTGNQILIQRISAIQKDIYMSYAFNSNNPKNNDFSGILGKALKKFRRYSDVSVCGVRSRNVSTAPK
ncbi:hypothetical protein TRFO_20981 [Tritrichomonas foetus]|uniref:Uncharacterized protein n=1 Tax=Tritrichomonas foetus TaxID=1144522 RepID=A0A1J4KG36_9EUKA|nr:hypothetical protein TRFO_20981 [Tritrichomonas foetus]|eukprot:OHT09986.1 hypothetical protein TRFO_20981 [Tritrichomonas foetus]